MATISFTVKTPFNYLFRFVLLVLASLSMASTVRAQDTRTVGLLRSDSSAYEGYTLLFSFSDTHTYLLDMCGRVVHTWTSDYGPGHNVRLLPDGRLLRMLDLKRSPIGDSAGGAIEIRSWDNQQLWYFEYCTDSVTTHHAMDVLPNGNVIMNAYELVTLDQAIAAGKDTSKIDSTIWADHIIEVKPTGPTSGEIVWEWHIWDHLIQDADSTKQNYGVIADHPERIDVNYSKSGGLGRTPDSWHGNSVAYNPDLDQIMVSSMVVSEVWIVDHSTTSEEARTSTGGRSGKGGDLLYRYGNPAAYGRGDLTDQKFYGSHDAHWIQNGYPDAGKLIVFNNGTGRPGGTASSVEIYTIPQNSDGSYILKPGEAYGPDMFDWQYISRQPPLFFSPIVSSAGVQPNGNVFICEGTRGRIFEVNRQGKIVWEYQNPISADTSLPQGTRPSGALVFRAYKYGKDYPAFAGRDLSEGYPLEQNPTPYPCAFGTVVLDVQDEQANLTGIFPNPFMEYVDLNGQPIGSDCKIVDLTGRIVWSGVITDSHQRVGTSSFDSGLYAVIVGGRRVATLMKAR